MFELPGLKEADWVPNRIGLIDADILAYHASASCEELPLPAAIRKLKDRLEQIQQEIQTREIRLYLTGTNNFRDKVATLKRYKGNRYDKHGNRIKPQPKWLQAIRDYMVDKMNALVCHEEEADDMLAKSQYKCAASESYHSIISSLDKDLRIVPGLHHNQMTGAIDTVTRLGSLRLEDKKVKGDGLWFFYAQLLMGDSVDYIPGLPKVTEAMKGAWPKMRRGGCGPMAAYYVLNDIQTEQELFDRVLFCYESYWDGKQSYKNWRTNSTITPTAVDMLTEQGQLLWMRSYDDEMWEPPTNLLKGR